MSNGRGPPADKIPKSAKRDSDGNIDVSEDQIAKLVEEINWNSLSPFEKWVLALLDENGLIDEP